jgi:hypothetical protein
VTDKEKLEAVIAAIVFAYAEQYFKVYPLDRNEIAWKMVDRIVSTVIDEINSGRVECPIKISQN